MTAATSNLGDLVLFEKVIKVLNIINYLIKNFQGIKVDISNTTCLDTAYTKNSKEIASVQRAFHDEQPVDDQANNIEAGASLLLDIKKAYEDST